ncbi:sulfatase, partial [Candidatus Poribacteria bacterium]
MAMNFVLFNPEEMRAETLGVYGHPLSQTPNMRRLAAEGVLFKNCFVQHTVCTPSRCSFTTGWYPHVRGHRTLWHLLRPHEPNLFKYLKRAGYQIIWWGKNDLLATDSFPESVTQVRGRRGRAFGRNPFDLDDPRYYTFLCEPFDGSVEEHVDYNSVADAIEFLRSNPKEPFLLF